MNLDQERIFADQQRLHDLDTAARHGTGRARFTVSADSHIRVDTNEAVAGDVLQRHRFDGGNFHFAQMRRCESFVATENSAHGRCHGQAQQIAASPVRLHIVHLSKRTFFLM